jgi:hypothetical protein
MTTPQFVEPKAFCSSPVKEDHPISYFKKENEISKRYQSSNSSDNKLVNDLNEKLLNQ